MEKFEKFLKKKYWGRKEFREAVERSAKKTPSIKPEEKIAHYLERIKRILEKKGSLFKEILYKRYIIKPEDITDEYFKNVILGNFAELRGYTREQLRDPQIRERVIQQFKEETGQDFATYQITEEERERLTRQIIEDQKRSFDYWIDYLTSPEAEEHYPPAFRYWAFAEMLKCGPYDPERRAFSRRERNTVAPFPELNQQALSLVLDEMLKKYTSQESALTLTEEQKEEFQKRLESESFNKLYGWALDYVKSLLTPEEQLKIIEGEWKVFPKGSDPKELTKKIQGFNTGWCIAGEATAESYLRQFDIHIFFSQDKEGNNTIPRVAIVTDGREIIEVRGIAKDQNLDSYITPVVESKLKELPGGERWQKQIEDMKKLADIYLKHLQGEELTIQDLRFLYEIDGKIEGFGYQKDPRIEEILRTRNIRKDLAQIMECDETQISLTEEEALKGNIKFHYGDLYLSSLTTAKGLKLPEEIGGSLHLESLTTAEGLKLPKRIGGDLYLSKLTSAEGLEFPEEIGGNLTLSSLTTAEGLKLPKRIGGGLYLLSLTSAEGLEFPEEIGGNLYLSSLTSAKGLEFPEEIGGDLDLSSLTSAKELKFPKRIGGTLYLLSLTSAEGLEFPEKIGGSLDLSSLTTAEGLKLPKRIGGGLYLSSLTSAEGLEFPEEIGGILVLSSLTSAEGLKLPKRIGGVVYLNKLPETEKEKLRKKYPQLRIY